ncbi:MAG: HAD family hydrolase [Alphaproteobacteria bacterium]|nr:HAD family hydrolase [Alphaproteobacteria bacterium]
MPSEETLELVIFDCDGVLIDSEIISATILVEQINALGLNVDFQYVQQNFLGRSFPRVVNLIREQFGVHLPPDFEDNYRSELLRNFETGLVAMPGIEPAIEGLAVAHCVATSSSPKRVRRSLELAGLIDHFQNRVFTASQVANGKPAPDLFLHAAEQMGVAPANCLVVEDSISGLDAAHAAGMTVWHFTGGSHLAGMAGDIPDRFSGLVTFDNWSDFLDMAPELKRKRTGNGHKSRQ